MIRLFALAAVCAVSACVPASTPPSSGGANQTVRPQPAPKPQPTPQPQPSAPVYQSDWNYWPVTPGDWVYRRDERGSIALFGPIGQDALATLRCDTTRRMLYFSRAGQVSGTTEMTVRASQGLQNYAAGPVPGTPYVAAAIQPADPMLDKLAYSRGRFVVEVTGLPPLKLPSWAEVARVIEDCRK
jgi:hypothetical protein